MTSCYICGRSGPPLPGMAICDPCRKTHMVSDPVISTRTILPDIDLDLSVSAHVRPDDGWSAEELRNDGYDLKREKAKIREVESQGFTVVRSDPRTLLLDLDSETAIERFNTMMLMAEKMYSIAGAFGWHSKSSQPGSRRWHVSVVLADNMAVVQRLCLQSVLGSDPKREMLNLRKVQELGMEEPSLLFRPPNTKNIDVRPPGSRVSWIK